MWKTPTRIRHRHIGHTFRPLGMVSWFESTSQPQAAQMPSAVTGPARTIARFLAEPSGSASYRPAVLDKSSEQLETCKITLVGRRSLVALHGRSLSAPIPDLFSVWRDFSQNSRGDQGSAVGRETPDPADCRRLTADSQRPVWLRLRRLGF